MYFFSPEHPPLTEPAQRALDWVVEEKLKSGESGEITTTHLLVRAPFRCHLRWMAPYLLKLLCDPCSYLLVLLSGTDPLLMVGRGTSRDSAIRIPSISERCTRIFEFFSLCSRKEESLQIDSLLLAVFRSWRSMCKEIVKTLEL